jgi:hypothetical protein
MAQPKTAVQDQALSKTYELVPIWLHFLAVTSPRGEELNEGLLAKWAETGNHQTSQQSNTWQREHTFPSIFKAPCQCHLCQRSARTASAEENALLTGLRVT